MNNRTALIIDDDAFLHNIQRVKSFLKGQSIIAMVKANAYGHGMSHVSKILEPEIDVFGVACLDEAKALRAIMPTKPIVLMGGIFSPEDWEAVFEGHFDVIIHSVWQIQSLLACKKTKKPINIWLKLESGMHRLGLTAQEIVENYEKLLAAEWVQKPLGLMTHFACSDDLNNPMTTQQIAQFEKVASQLTACTELKRSLANSGGIMGWSAARQGFVRPGIMLYGISPFADKTGHDLGLKPAMSFISHVMALKTCEKGESVGYGATWRAKKSTQIAIVGAGYGDGYPRHISSDAKAWVNGGYYPIIGRVSMDMLVLDVGDNASVQIGDQVELWGPHLSVEIVAAFANTSPYELVTQVRSRNKMF
jgi:alanine racemase